MTSIQTRQQAPRVIAPTRRGPVRPAGGGVALSPKEAFRIIRRRKWLILIFLGVFTVISVAGTFVWKRYLPIYTAKAFIRLEPPARTVLRGTTQYLRDDTIDRYKKSNAAVVKSLTVLNTALDREDMMDTKWFKRLRQWDSTLKRARVELRDEISVSLMPNTDLLAISMSIASGDPREKEQLPTIVNAVAISFVDQANKSANLERDKEIGTLESRHAGLKRELLAVQNRVKDAMASPEVPAMRRQADILGAELQDLTRRLTELQILQTEYEAARDGILKQHEMRLLDTNPMVLRSLDMDPMLRSMEQQVRGAMTRKEVIESKYGANHPLRKSFDITVKSLRKEIDQRQAEVIESSVQSLMVGYEQQLTTITRQLVDIDERRNQVMSARKDLNRNLADIDNMEADAKRLEDEFRIVGQRLSDARMARKALPVSIRQPAEIPIEPSWPQYKVMVSGGCLLGLVVGLGLAFLLELMDTSVKTPTDVTRRVDMPLLGMIPHAEDMEEEIEDFRAAGLLGLDLLVNESFRELRSNLLFSGLPEQRRTLLVTSPSPEDGRTTVAVNLAVAIANNGSRVLLVDGNFRRPAVGSVVGVEDPTGLSDVLTAQKPWADCVHETAVANLSVMASGKLPPNPNELLGGDLAKSVLSEMAQQYDQVIIDGPPLLLISDAGVMASEVDGVVLVVRAGVNTYGMVTRCRNHLDHVGAHVIGVALNGVRTTAGGYLQKNYDAFHDYHEELA